jgi:sarcosine oxidase, subunit gamma
VAERDHSSPSTQPGHYGEPGNGVVFAEATIASAWNVQGDAEQPRFADAARSLFGVPLPVTPKTVARSNAISALWLGPKSWLLLGRNGSLLADFNARRDALNAVGGALFEVSASRIAWTIDGPRAASVLAKGCPLDFHPRVFPPGSCAQSLLGHVNALFVSEGDGFTVLVARSFARDVWLALCQSAAQYGYEVKPQAPYR